MRVFLTGASGYVGARLTATLAGAGAEVIASGLPGTEGSIPQGPGIHALGVDLDDQPALTQVSRGAAVVYHLAAVLPGADATEYARVNVEGTRTVARAAALAGVPRLVVLSSTAVYRPSPLRWPLTEEAPLNEPVSWVGVRGYGESKVAAEQILRELSRGGGPAVTVLRASTVYGPGSRSISWLSGLLDRPPLGIRPGWSTPSLQWLYIDDLVHSLIEAGTRPRAAGVTVNVAGADLFSVYELMTAAGRARGGDGGAPHPDGGTGLAAPWEPPDMLRFSIAAAADVLDFAPTPIEEALPASLPGDVGG